MTDEPSDPSDQHAHRRGLKFRRRDDYAVELFREALDHLDDAERVDRVLRTLGRFYNPYVDQPIVDPAARRRILEALEDGQSDRARVLLEERLTLYARSDDADRS